MADFLYISIYMFLSLLLNVSLFFFLSFFLSFSFFFFYLTPVSFSTIFSYHYTLFIYKRNKKNKNDRFLLFLFVFSFSFSLFQFLFFLFSFFSLHFICTMMVMMIIPSGLFELSRHSHIHQDIFFVNICRAIFIDTRLLPFILLHFILRSNRILLISLQKTKQTYLQK